MADHSEQENFVNGWATASRGSSHQHLLPYPVDLGDREPALCEVRPVLGWVEIETREVWYCHTCLSKFRQMYEADDPRLTVADRDRFRQIERFLLTRPEVQDDTVVDS